MANKQTVDYIRTHLGKGHTEANLRQHFLASGWAKSSVDDAFAQYHRSQTGKSVRVTKRPKLRRRVPKWSKTRWIKTVIGTAVFLIVAIIAYGVISARAHRVTPTPPPRPLTLKEQQAVDVHTVAGAVSQYVVANDGILPTVAQTASDKVSLELCNSTCDPTNSVVSALSVYKAANVKIRAYAPDLAVPDGQTIYLVAGAKCSDKGGIGDPSTVARAMVLLYTQISGSTLVQKCIVL